MKETQICIHCQKIINGRSDKKFCNQHCRTEYNNRKYQGNKKLVSVKRINHILIQNREILKDLIERNKKMKVDINTLSIMGFHFDFHTHTIKAKGKTQYYCYEFGYMRDNLTNILLLDLLQD
jgi:hypothetical protein